MASIIFIIYSKYHKFCLIILQYFKNNLSNSEATNHAYCYKFEKFTFANKHSLKSFLKFILYETI